MIHLPLLLLGWSRGEEAQILFFIPGGQIWRPKIYETRKRWRQNAILFLKRASLRQALYLKCFHTIALHILEFYLKQSIIWQTDNHTLFTILDASWSEYWYSVSNHTHLSSHIISFIFYFIPTHISSGPCDGNAMQDTGTAGTGCTGCSAAVFWPRSAPLHG